MTQKKFHSILASFNWLWVVKRWQLSVLYYLSLSPPPLLVSFYPDSCRSSWWAVYFQMAATPRQRWAVSVNLHRDCSNSASQHRVERKKRRVTWVVSQLAVRWAGEPQVVQLGASLSLESLSDRERHSSSRGGKSLPSNKWSVNTVPLMQNGPIWYLPYLRCNSKCHSLQRM